MMHAPPSTVRVARVFRHAPLLGMIAALAAFGPTSGAAQVLSPGQLAEPHAELEGVRHCTDCHELGKRGIAADRCLGCHEALGARVAAGQGYHATVPSDGCTQCHQDHLGRDFDLLRIDEGAFPHADTGYELVLSHAEVDCRDCHRGANITDPGVRSLKTERGALDRTFLGLDRECASCHATDSPHGTQFSDRGCTDCHDTGAWEEASGFDHTATRFTLDGRHEELGCADCHGTGTEALYRPIAFGTCADCHSDPHAGAMRGACASCHTTGGWQLLAQGAVDSGFDHARTSFRLVGAHATATCTSCHRRGTPPTGELLNIRYQRGTADRTYPSPVATSCASCHVDRHAFPDATGRWAGCSECHSEAGWTPSAFGATRHTDESAFPLTGAHLATPCFACHEDPERGHTRFTLSIGVSSCVACHTADDPHEGRYEAIACETCHVTDAFDVVEYPHPQADLDGRACASCHDPDDPHEGQFEGRDCASCHVTGAFAISSFDHSTTRFPLDGAHDDASCAACHAQETVGGRSFFRYRPLGTECVDCHGGLS